MDRPAAEVKADSVVEGMKRYLAFRGSDEKPCALAWSLGAWMVKAPESGSAASLVPTMTVLLLIFSAIMLVRTGVNATIGAGTGVDGVLSGAMWLVVGIAAGMLVDDVKGKLDR